MLARRIIKERSSRSLSLRHARPSLSSHLVFTVTVTVTVAVAVAVAVTVTVAVTVMVSVRQERMPESQSKTLQRGNPQPDSL